MMGVDNLEMCMRIAKEIHMEYCEERKKHDTSEILPEFGDLADDIKCSLVIRVSSYIQFLVAMGFYILENDSTVNEGYVEVQSLPEDKTMLLAKMMHEQWFEERISNGWDYGISMDVANKRAPYLVRWDRLPGQIKKIDIDSAKALPQQIRKAGYHLIQIGEGPLRKNCLERKFPLIISSFGHVNVDPESAQLIKRESDRFFKELKEEYSSTTIILMSGLSEGSDRIIAWSALDNGIVIAPVMARSVDFCKQFCKGEGYASLEDSLLDLDSILGHKSTLSPCIIDLKTDLGSLFNTISSFMLTNSHMMIAAWNGEDNGAEGGTYHAIHTAFHGVDPHARVYCDPKNPFMRMDPGSPVDKLNSNLNMIMYWIPVNRKKCDNRGLLDNTFIDDSRPTRIVTNPPEVCCFVSPYAAEDGSNILKNLRKIVSDKESHRNSSSESFYLENISTHFRITYTMPDYYAEQFRRIDELNREFDSVDDESIGDDIPVMDPDPLPEMMARYKKAYFLSKMYKQKNARTVRRLIILTTVTTILFNLMVLMSRSTVMTGLYFLLYAGTLVLTWNHHRTREHRMYIEYRTLAENIRVDYYWSLMKVKDSAYNHCPDWSKNSLSWLKAAMIGNASFTMNNYTKVESISFDERMDYSLTNWMERSYRKYDSRSRNNEASESRYLTSNRGLVTLSIVITMSSTLMLLFFSSFANETLFDLNVSSNDGIDFTLNVILKLMLIAVLSIVSFRTMSHEFNHESRKNQYQILSKVFESAKNRLDSSFDFEKLSVMETYAHISEIFHELGIRALAVFNNWAIETIDTDFETKDNYGPKVDD